MLRLEGLIKRFGTTVAVRNVNLELVPGQMVGIIGRSGAGKSTLLRLINRLLEPTQGTVYFQGVNVTALRERDLRAWRARLQALEDLRDLTLESRDHLFSRKLLF